MNMTFLCLANSRKEGGRCVAGIRLDDFSWFRPVSDNEHGELDPSHYILDDGNEASILDIIRMDFIDHQPEPHQPENWLIDDNYQWELIERIDKEKAHVLLDNLLTTDVFLFGNQNDCVPYSEIEDYELDRSLCLIEPSDIFWEITKSRHGRRQTRAKFTFNDFDYNLVVTDPEWESILRSLDFGEYSHDNLLFGKAKHPGSEDRILLTVSLGEPFNKKCYKLVAGVICLPQT